MKSENASYGQQNRLEFDECEEEELLDYESKQEKEIERQMKKAFSESVEMQCVVNGIAKQISRNNEDKKTVHGMRSVEKLQHRGTRKQCGNGSQKLDLKKRVDGTHSVVNDTEMEIRVNARLEETWRNKKTWNNKLKM